MVRYDEKSNSKTRQSSHGKSPSVKIVALEDFKIRKPLAKKKKKAAPAMRVVPPLTKSSLEPVREKIRAFIQSMPAERRIEHKYVMKVKGKCLNNFLGIVKSDLARLALEGFPEELNKQLYGLMMLPRQDLIWFDVQIEKRVATLKGNFFVGVNLGHSFYKLGFLCLIGIAHLPESQAGLCISKRVEFRPTYTTNIGESMAEELLDELPKNGQKIVKNLVCAIKTVAGHVLSRVPICGNVRYEDEPSKPRRRPIDEEDISEEDDDEEYGVDAITRTLEKEFKLRNIEEEEKLSAGGMVAYRKRGVYQSVAGLKGSQAGGI